MADDILTIDRLIVRSGRIECTVSLAPGAPRFMTGAWAVELKRAFPDIGKHACVNDEGTTFSAVADRTSLPHVLEHVVIDLQVHDSSAAGLEDASYVGTTEWLDEARTKARVEVSFTDDLVALRCFRDAANFINRMVVT